MLLACTGVSGNVTAVTPFELNQYLRQWHEIARLDHRFEQGLTQVSTHYSLNAAGSVKVLNRGFDQTTQQWQDAPGEAKFVGATVQGRLKVSFFGRFYGG